MIGRLKGIVDARDDAQALIDVQGVGYVVSASTRTLAALSVGEAATVEIETIVREDQISLYGFADTAERDSFRLLTSVQSVGAKVALAILSTLPVDRLYAAIAAGDKALVATTKGVGPKMAQRIVTELKDKVAAIPVTQTLQAEAGGAGVTASPALDDAVSALVNLGFPRADAHGAVSRLLLSDPSLAAGELIRLGLKELGSA